jgi:hypothetical protein
MKRIAKLLKVKEKKRKKKKEKEEEKCSIVLLNFYVDGA